MAKYGFMQCTVFLHWAQLTILFHAGKNRVTVSSHSYPARYYIESDADMANHFLGAIGTGEC